MPANSLPEATGGAGMILADPDKELEAKVLAYGLSCFDYGQATARGSEGRDERNRRAEKLTSLLSSIRVLEEDAARLDWLERERDWNLAMQERGITADFPRKPDRFTLWANAEDEASYATLREAIDAARAARTEEASR